MTTRPESRLAPLCGVCAVRHWSRQPHVGQAPADQPQISRDQPKRSTVEGPAPDAHITKVDGCKCLKTKCGHEWVPRDLTKKPQYCPKCKSRTWNRATV